MSVDSAWLFGETCPCELDGKPNFRKLLTARILRPGLLLRLVLLVLLLSPFWLCSFTPADDVLTQLKTTLQSHGYTTGSKHVLDFGVYDDKQADLAFNHSVFIAAHGQASANFVYSPECAVQLELFPNGGYNHMVSDPSDMRGYRGCSFTLY